MLGEWSNPNSEQLISIRVVPQSKKKCLANVRSFEITTTRENIDTTTLNNRFRQQYEDGLILGQGVLQCFWKATDECTLAEGNESEFAEYVAQLCIRLVQGCDFHGYFFLYYSEETDEKATWYECEDCLVTNVAVNVDPQQMINTQIQFVTSGPIVLRHGYPPSYILQEDPDPSLLLQEDGSALMLNNPND